MARNGIVAACVRDDKAHSLGALDGLEGRIEPHHGADIPELALDRHHVVDTVNLLALARIVENRPVGILRDGVALFLSGALIPLEFLPEGVRAIANFSPWAQALYVPISFLSGIRNPNTLPEAMLGQLFGIVILCLISRWIFARAVRVLTVQGG